MNTLERIGTLEQGKNYTFFWVVLQSFINKLLHGLPTQPSPTTKAGLCCIYSPSFEVQRWVREASSQMFIF